MSSHDLVEEGSFEAGPMKRIGESLWEASAPKTRKEFRGVSQKSETDQPYLSGISSA